MNSITVNREIAGEIKFGYFQFHAGERLVVEKATVSGVKDGTTFEVRTPKGLARLHLYNFEYQWNEEVS